MLSIVVVKLYGDHAHPYNMVWHGHSGPATQQDSPMRLPIRTPVLKEKPLPEDPQLHTPYFIDIPHPYSLQSAQNPHYKTHTSTRSHIVPAHTVPVRSASQPSQSVQ